MTDSQGELGAASAAYRGFPFSDLLGYTIGRYTGRSVGLNIGEGALAACGSFGSPDVQLFLAENRRCVSAPGGHVTLRAIDVDGAMVSSLFSGDNPAGPLRADDAFIQLADRVVQTADF